MQVLEHPVEDPKVVKSQVSPLSTKAFPHHVQLVVGFAVIVNVAIVGLEEEKE